MIMVKIAEKAADRVKKRNLKGTTSHSHNSFSVLSDTEIKDRSVAMGENLHKSDLEHIVLLRDMEQARFCSAKKEKEILTHKNDKEVDKEVQEPIHFLE